MCIGGYINQDLGKYYAAVKYFELSSKNIQTEHEEWIKNLTDMADCYYYNNDYNNAAENYRMAANLHAYIHNVDMKYIQRDSKNQLKRRKSLIEMMT